VLLELVEKDFSKKINKIKELFPMGITDFDVMRELFLKGDLVVAANSDRIYRIKSAEYRVSSEGVRYLHLNCTYIDCDGKNFGTVGTELTIYSFNGVKYINALSVYPLKNHPDTDAFKSALLTRGKKFAALRGQHFKAHNAIAASLDSLGNLESRSAVESRVMVDTATYNRYGYGYRIRISPLADNRVELTNEELMLCTDQIPVFSLQDKHFFTAAVDNIQDIVFNDKVFDQLVLPEAQKQMVRVLVENHAKGAAAFDDFVKGKGKGLIAVLHGPPGVGKTMTAEAVAEHTRRPLYVVTSGELGHDAKTMEDGLKRVLDLSRIFDAVLLLDEADVFLEARSTNDLKRNALVSVFLRMLEYYQGIMFLTTNRVASFDDAFHSRIHISLQYRELDTAARHQVWKNFGAAMEANVTDEEYRKLAAYEVNGRRVKNIWRTAQALAADKDEKVGMRHLEAALAAMGAMNQGVLRRA
jgi:AAA+ superfamily predicted ATPase